MRRRDHRFHQVSAATMPSQSMLSRQRRHSTPPRPRDPGGFARIMAWSRAGSRKGERGPVVHSEVVGAHGEATPLFDPLMHRCVAGRRRWRSATVATPPPAAGLLLALNPPRQLVRALALLSFLLARRRVTSRRHPTARDAREHRAWSRPAAARHAAAAGRGRRHATWAIRGVA